MKKERNSLITGRQNKALYQNQRAINSYLILLGSFEGAAKILSFRV
jgi:hypothetical protein